MKAVLRNGNHIILNSFFQSYHVAQLQDHRDVEYDIMNDTVRLSGLAYTIGSKANLKLHGALSNGEVVNTFYDQDYRTLPVKGKVVVDVGANIADSAIYFALRDADRVIGIEPYPKNYEIAKKNIELNDFSNKITMVLAGCSAKPGYINIDMGFESGIASQMNDNLNQGTRVPLLTLEHILNENKIQRGETVLKMDCEGCEYDIILSAKDDILKWFSHILIEYHYGYKDLKERLEKCDFDVSLFKRSGQVGGATAFPDMERPGRWYYKGYIYARRKYDMNGNS